MLRHSRFRPSGSTTRKKMIRPPNITRRILGMMFSRSASRKEQPAERFENPARHDRQQGHEDRAEDRAEHRAEPADDDHRQIVDRDVDLELLVIRDAE